MFPLDCFHLTEEDVTRWLDMRFATERQFSTRQLPAFRCTP